MLCSSLRGHGIISTSVLHLILILHTSISSLFYCFSFLFSQQIHTFLFQAFNYTYQASHPFLFSSFSHILKLTMLHLPPTIPVVSITLLMVQMLPNCLKMAVRQVGNKQRRHLFLFKCPILDDLPMFKLPRKRLTKKPSKFCSPFKPSIMSRPPPNLDISLSMHAFVCADDSSLKRFVLISFWRYHTLPSIFQNVYWSPYRKTLMHFGTQSLIGQDIALSFGVGKFIDFVFMDAFAKCIAKDYLIVHP